MKPRLDHIGLDVSDYAASKPFYEQALAPLAERLVISPKTVGNHVEHIYGKINASTRAAAGLFAMRHGLLPEEEFPVSVPA